MEQNKILMIVALIILLVNLALSIKLLVKQKKENYKVSNKVLSSSTSSITTFTNVAKINMNPSNTPQTDTLIFGIKPSSVPYISTVSRVPYEAVVRFTDSTNINNLNMGIQIKYDPSNPLYNYNIRLLNGIMDTGAGTKLKNNLSNLSETTLKFSLETNYINNSLLKAILYVYDPSTSNTPLVSFILLNYFNPDKLNMALINGLNVGIGSNTATQWRLL